MTNSRKAWIAVAIVGAVIVVLATHLTSSDSNQTTVQTSGKITESAATPTATPRLNDTRSAASNVARVAPGGGSSNVISRAPRQIAVVNAAPAPGVSVDVVRQKPQLETQSMYRPPARALQSTDAQKSFDSNPGPARPDRGQDDLHRRGSNPVAAAMTDQLVKESAKLDPALPPPDLPGGDVSNKRGSNPVAAAMTDQLVRESAKLDSAPQASSQSGSQ